MLVVLLMNLIHWRSPPLLGLLQAYALQLPVLLLACGAATRTWYSAHRQWLLSLACLSLATSVLLPVMGLVSGIGGAREGRLLGWEQSSGLSSLAVGVLAARVSG